MPGKNHEDVCAAIDALGGKIERLAEENRRRAEEERKHAEQRAEEDRRWKAEAKAQQKELNKQLGGLGNGLGSLAEGIIAPNLRKLLRQVNIRWSATHPNVQVTRNGKETEIDLLAVGEWRAGGRVVVPIEVTTRLVQTELEQALDKFHGFFEFFPEYRTYDLVGGVAGMKINPETARRAEAAGLLVIGPSGETARLLNAPRFKPKVWRALRDGR